MCCLFGLIDYRDTLSRRQKTKMVRALADWPPDLLPVFAVR